MQTSPHVPTCLLLILFGALLLKKEETSETSSAALGLKLHCWNPRSRKGGCCLTLLVPSEPKAGDWLFSYSLAVHKRSTGYQFPCSDNMEGRRASRPRGSVACVFDAARARVCLCVCSACVRACVCMLAGSAVCSRVRTCVSEQGLLYEGDSTSA